MKYLKLQEKQKKKKKKKRNDTLKMYSMHRGTMPRDSLSLGGPKILFKNKEKGNQTNYTERHVINLYEKNNEMRTCKFFLTPSVGHSQTHRRQQLQQKRVKYQVKNNKNENNASVPDHRRNNNYCSRPTHDLPMATRPVVIVQTYSVIIEKIDSQAVP